MSSTAAVRYEWRVVDRDGRPASLRGLDESQVRAAAERWTNADDTRADDGPYRVQRRLIPEWEDVCDWNMADERQLCGKCFSRLPHTSGCDRP
jgi:hypothetical protein